MNSTNVNWKVVEYFWWRTAVIVISKLRPRGNDPGTAYYIIGVELLLIQFIFDLTVLMLSAPCLASVENKTNKLSIQNRKMERTKRETVRKRPMQ